MSNMPVCLVHLATILGLARLLISANSVNACMDSIVSQRARVRGLSNSIFLVLAIAFVLADLNLRIDPCKIAITTVAQYQTHVANDLPL